ncbi:MAG: flagellar biosynthetic protein FliO [Gammaproteobacteria bacterium]|nr:flagellar biosynthetic protein FliO [Gammaproteobacteria bacterium]
MKINYHTNFSFLNERFGLKGIWAKLRVLTKGILWSLLGVSLSIPASEATKPSSVATGKLQPIGAEYLVQYSLGLIVVLSAVVALVWVLRRFNRFQSSVGGTLKTLGGLTLGGRERIILVQVGDTQLLIGVAPGRIQTLHVLDEPLKNRMNVSKDGQHGMFSKTLSNVMKKDVMHDNIK